MLRLSAMLNSMKEYSNGCFYVRIHVPFLELKNRGHLTSYISHTGYDFKDVAENSDAVVFMRTYSKDPLRDMWRFQARGVPCVYELDDDIWDIPDVNPASSVFKEKSQAVLQVEAQIAEADYCVVSTEPLKKKVKKFAKGDVFVVPNSVNPDKFVERPKKGDKLRIGWAGGANHYGDLELIVDALLELDKKYDFSFCIQGLSSSPIESEMYGKHIAQKWGSEGNVQYRDTALRVYDKLKQLKDFQHVPFYPPELYPGILSQLDWDIGLIPVTGDNFNKSKSCIKFYEYASVGTTAVASDAHPYKKEVNYRAENTPEGWVKAIATLLDDKEMRYNIGKEQRDWVMKNRTVQVVGGKWEEMYEIIQNKGRNIKRLNK